ncbi:MAG: DUF1638 domain-containing protein [Desulfurivibrio sp.]
MMTVKAGPRPKTVVACQVLVPELQAVLGSRADLEIISLPAALHTDVDRLNRELGDQLAICRRNQENELCVVYGRACSPGIEGVVESHRASCLEADNCLDALLGPLKTEAEAEGAFVLTPGWIRAWPSIMEAMGWDEVDTRLNLGRYRKAVLFDTGVEPRLTDEEILWFFEVSGLYVETRPVDLHFLQQQLERWFP